MEKRDAGKSDQTSVTTMKEEEKDIIDIIKEDADILTENPGDSAETPGASDAEAPEEVVVTEKKRSKIRNIPAMLFSPFRKKKGEKRHFSSPLKILDWYILKKFLGTYFMATLLMLMVITVFSVTEKLDAFLTAPLKETLFDYFASFLPDMANQLSPLFVFISVIFFTTKLADNSEIIAMVSSGITFKRLVRPYMVGAAVIAAMTFSLTNYIIPPTNIRQYAYYNKYVKNKAVEYGSNVQLMVRPGEIAYFGRFDNTTKQGYRFSLDKFDGKILVSRLTASSVEYDSTKMYHWTLRDYMIRDFDGMNEKIRRGSNLDSIIPIEPKDFLISDKDQQTLTTPQLTDYIRKQKMRGVANIKGFEIEKERRTAATAAAFILTLIGVSLSAKKVKGGMGINIAIGLALSFSYILFNTVTSSFAINGYTSPAVAMEIPNIVYLIIGLILYRRASKY